MRFVRIIWPERSLIYHSEEVSEEPVTHKFYDWVNSIENHCADDHCTNIVEPESIEFRVNAAKESLEER